MHHRHYSQRKKLSTYFLISFALACIVIRLYRLGSGWALRILPSPNNSRLRKIPAFAHNHLIWNLIYFIKREIKRSWQYVIEEEDMETTVLSLVFPHLPVNKFQTYSPWSHHASTFIVPILPSLDPWFCPFIRWWQFFHTIFIQSTDPT